MTEDRAKKIYDQEMKVEQDYSEYLTGKKYLILITSNSHTINLLNFQLS